MTKDILNDLIAQNQKTCDFTFNEITQENSVLKLNDDTASVGFIYRHIGEIMHLLAQFLGIPTDVENTTMGQKDTGKVYNKEESQKLIDDGYQVLYDLVKNLSENQWKETLDTPFFGPISRVRLLGHILYHTTYHCGQITLTLKRGK
ncbi:DinB family protein [Flagellimonas marinaquae]|uniref:DinB family protein n=1 Tax=Flagellimonas aurea TaxID=2915619 RepID=UPI001CE148C3|nr:DinB family protein [Allomuricauda aquimarina]